MSMDRAAAVQFFADLFGSEHRIPGGAGAVKQWGSAAWALSTPQCILSTYDPDYLTRLVLLAHDRCVRAELVPGGPRRVRIAIWQRNTREGSSMVRHPTIEQALAAWREGRPA